MATRARASRTVAPTLPRTSGVQALTVDCVVFGFDGEALKVLLIRRAAAPYAGRWALPGGFVRADEALEDAARRELEEEAGVRELFLEQLYTFGDPRRDPRGRVVTVAYYALVRLGGHTVRAATDAGDARWFPAEAPPPLAFDHATILAAALERLRAKVRYQPIGFELLPPKFTLSELQQLYETLLGTALDKRNFRKKILATGVLAELAERQRAVHHRAAKLYRFDRVRYGELVRRGGDFAI
jgi:8-oxo-dGTP diphosphatase